MKTITLKKQGYYIEGTASLITWGGGKASIPMKSFNVQHLKEIKDNINDNGFGVQEITGAICEIYESFGVHKEYKRQIVIGKVFDFVFDNHYELV